MSRVVITGITGLVGSNLSSALAARHEVVGICRKQLADAPFASIAIDLAGDWNSSQLPAKVDVVIHAAQSDNWQAPEGVLDVFGVNLAATARLLDYAGRAGASQFVLLSTGGLYGSAGTPLTESSPLRIPDGVLRYYFETKKSAEGFADLYRDRMAVSVLRPFFIYGAGQRIPKLVPRLIDTIKLGQPVRLRGDGGTRLNPVHVRDVVALIESSIAGAHSGAVN